MDLGPNFLRGYQWVFGNSKSAVVRTVMRWGQSSIRCEFYDWAENEPDEHRFFFKDRENYRASQLAKKMWTTEDEADHRKYTPKTYRGWWQFRGLPNDYNASDWFSPNKAPEFSDPNMSLAEVASAARRILPRMASWRQRSRNVRSGWH